MSSNTELWDRLGRTDPAHTKQFKRGGGFAGTAIKPMWSYRRMTEEFGPCGTGWGVGEPSFQVVTGPEGEVLVFCTASIWYGADRATVFGVGGDKAVGKNKYGLQTDDEAFKKAFTDAITNALKMIGVGADVHMGMFDDSKYVNTMREEFSEPKPEAKKTSAAEMKRGLEAITQELLDCRTPNDAQKIWKAWVDVFKSQQWSKDYIDIARDRIQARGRELKEATEAEDVFPGDLNNSHQRPLEMQQ